MKRSKARQGFTLVEIMIVVVIIGILATMAIPTFNEIRLQSRVKAVTNNLRQFSAAAAQYMLDKGVTQAAYSDLVGTQTDNYMVSISPVAGEDYTTLVLEQTSSQVSISATTFGTVTYNL
ncbi:MAG: prepilin-type N-terminal cleavage/methylation domain-containing protein [Opitutales bacterium]|jgi:prepilin-type N-terminal cleavage/methylation domain-containing protein